MRNDSALMGTLGEPSELTDSEWPKFLNPVDKKKLTGKMGYLPLVRNRYTVGELFAGAGGMTLGAHMAGGAHNRIKHSWVTDISNDACETIRRNGIVDNVIESDVRNLDISELSPIDGLAFGFPCNDFTIIGKRKGMDGERGLMYEYGLRVLEEKKPRFFIAENVKGLNQFDGVLSRIFTDFSSIGYDTFVHFYKFEDYGIPQNRHRFIFFGFRSDLGIDFLHPAPGWMGFGPSVMTAEEALRDMDSNLPNHVPVNHSQLVQDRIASIPVGGNVYSGIPEHLQIKHKSGLAFSTTYRKIYPDRPSFTVTGSGGGGSHLYHWQENRALTNRERARLQTFPDWYKFCGHKDSVRRQIGMAVPVRAAKMLFMVAMWHLDGNRFGKQIPFGLESMAIQKAML